MRSQATLDQGAPMPDSSRSPTFLKTFTTMKWGNAR
jgi:hypothetical protein